MKWIDEGGGKCHAFVERLKFYLHPESGHVVIKMEERPADRPGWLTNTWSPIIRTTTAQTMDEAKRLCEQYAKEYG